MQKIVECPACHKKGLKVDIGKEYEVVTTGEERLRDLPCICVCSVCNRKIRYKVVKKEDN
jgi:hypothetical protein